MTRRTDVVAAIEAKGAKSKCECCGHSEWQVPNVAGDAETALTLGMLIGLEATEGVTFIPMICRNCGYTRMLHKETLLSRA